MCDNLLCSCRASFPWFYGFTVYLFLFSFTNVLHFILFLFLLCFTILYFFTKWSFVASFSDDGTFTNILTFWVIFISSNKWGFPGGSDSKESACNAGDLGLIPSQEDPLEKGMVTHCSILAWRISLTDDSPWGLKESDMIEQIRISTWLHFSLDKDLLLVIFCIGLLPPKNLLFFNQEISLFCFYFWKLFILTAYRIPGWQFPFSSTLSSFVLFSWWDASSLSIMAFSHSKMWFSLLWPSLRHCYLQEFGLPVSELWLLYTLSLSPRWSCPCTSWLGKSPEHQWWDSIGELQPIETILQSRNHEDFESNIKYLKWSRLRNHATLSWVH